jgi:hypothetical protein
MPDLWDPNPDHVFNGSGQQPDSAPNGNHDHTKEVPLRDHRGRLQPPAYVFDRADDRVGGQRALARRRPVRARLAPPVPWAWPFPSGVEPWGLGRSNQETLAACGGPAPGPRCLVPGPGARFGSSRTAC